jgi:hypothetical protein
MARFYHVIQTAIIDKTFGDIEWLNSRLMFQSQATSCALLSKIIALGDVDVAINARTMIVAMFMFRWSIVFINL